MTGKTLGEPLVVSPEEEREDPLAACVGIKNALLITGVVILIIWVLVITFSNVPW